MNDIGNELKEWQTWLSSAAGQYLIDWEQKQLDALVGDLFGFHALQLGFPQVEGLRANRMPHQWLALPSEKACASIATDFRALPFAEQSLDLIILPHTLEIYPDPHATLREVERVLVPEGRVIICGLNPLSLWGARVTRERFYARLGSRKTFMPIQSEFIGPLRMKDWLTLLGFEVERGGFGLYKPSFESQGWLSRLNWMELAGKRWWPILGSAYILTAVKRVKGMRLLGASWKKPLHRSALLTQPSATSKHTAEKKQDEHLF
ncbi:MAG: methyltransferase domain-containing protein [Betaproteobacteria bacterium]|jgi:SAM-dependent methyltransferase